MQWELKALVHAQNPTVFSGYEIPAGTYVVTQNQISSQLKTYCPVNPSEFMPERFMKEKDKKGQSFKSKLFVRGFGFSKRRQGAIKHRAQFFPKNC